MPELHIITGSNGAGKSTVGSTYLPDYIRCNYTIFDGDKISAEKRKELLNQKKITFKEARNIANEWLLEHFDNLVAAAIKMNDHFVYEGHFTEESAWDVIRRFRKKKYLVYLTFFGLKVNLLSNRDRSIFHFVRSKHLQSTIAW